MKFGTSGLRGLVEDMTDATCAAWTGAFLVRMADGGAPPAAVLLGRDLRPSSPRIAAACAAAIREAGATAVDCGVLPTPALALEAERRDAPAVMVTGSHIPFDRNGLKFFRPGGEIDKADEAAIAAAHAAGVRPRAAAPGGDAADAEARARYVARGRGFFAPGALAGRRIGVWQHSAAGRDLLVEALASFGAEPVPLGRSDLFVPIDTEAVSPADAARARAWAAENALDALVSTDGDGDRPLIADETGAFLRGDLLGLLTARILGADAIATPISSTTAIERSGWVARVARCRIGSPYVIEAMARLAADGARLPVGFEANGGFLLGGAATRPGGALAPLPTRDAMLPILAVLTDAAARGLPLSTLAAEAPLRATASDRLSPAPPDRSGPRLSALAEDPQARAALLAAIGVGPARSVDLTDGVRLTLEGDEIVHLRASGNAPELRAYAEAADAARAGALVAAALAAMRAAMDES
jgi:phosphomannomutase